VFYFFKKIADNLEGETGNTFTVSDAPSRFTAIRMSVSAQCNPAEELNKLVTIAERGCIAANTLRSAVELSIKIV
jgi:organic hydroperoxide reductase OsmC/OhrA